MASAEPLLNHVSSEDAVVRRRLLLSHAATRMGTQAWFFCTPLFLLRFTPGSLLGPGLFGLCSYSTGLFISPRLGKWADVTDRLLVVRSGVLLQAVAVSGNVVLIFASAFLPHDEARVQVACLLLACAFGMLEKLSFPLTDVPVKRDWVPTLLSHDRQILESTNMRMSQIDLSAEVVAPFLAGVLIQFPEWCGAFAHDGGLPLDVIGFLLVGFVNALSCLPQYILLRKVYNSRTANLRRQGGEKAVARKAPLEAGAWKLWITHPFGVPLLSLSYAFLYLTVLSPHGALLTAFLSQAGMPASHLSLLRGFGAVAGLLGVTMRPTCLRFLPERATNTLGVGALAFFMAMAAASYHAWTMASSSGLALYAFGLCVVLGRPGLYAFELGIINQAQMLVDERSRASVGAVDDALLSGFTLAIYLAGTVFNKPDQFGGLVDVSAAFVALGCFTYILWCLAFHEHRHQHAQHGHGHGDAEHGHGHSHNDHPHTIQVERNIDEDGYHSHLHFNPFWLKQ